MEYPRYRCHKEVHALKIVKIEPVRDQDDIVVGYEITPEEGEQYPSFRVALGYVNKHNPQVGGYYVLYEDGYQSWSPAKAFEDGYTRM
jgi:hypothetical protein